MKISIENLVSSFFFFKAFTAEDGKKFAGMVVEAFGGDLGGKRVVVIDHPPTAGLFPLLEGLEVAGAEVYVRDHHGDSDREGAVPRVRALLGERAYITTRQENPACSSLVAQGEFSQENDILIADADMDGLTAALKAAGAGYDTLDADAAVLDGAIALKTRENLSPLGFKLVQSWGALPEFTDSEYSKVFAQIANAFADAALGKGGEETLDVLIAEYGRKVENAKVLAGQRIKEVAPGVNFADIVDARDYDKPTFLALLNGKAKLTVARQGGAMTKNGHAAQYSIQRTKAGESINLLNLVPSDWARGPKQGVLANQPFIIHLSPERWEQLKEVIFAAAV